jgi:LmbE family N-acetylglucosaminyl deacetylase
MSNPANMLRSSQPLFLKDIPFPADLRILVLAPHPDDFDAIGVTLRFFRDNGNPIDLAVVTSSASGVEDEYCLEMGAAVSLMANASELAKYKAVLREKEQKASCRFFGLPEDKLDFLRLSEDADGHPEEKAENRERIRQYLQASHPDIVFLPHWNDTNAGHQRTHAMFRQVALDGGYALVAFLNRDPKTIQMRPDLYTLFGEIEAEWKGQLLRFHQSQHQRNLRMRRYGFDERILRMNRETAVEIHSQAAYAEVFELEFYG